MPFRIMKISKITQIRVWRQNDNDGDDNTVTKIMLIIILTDQYKVPGTVQSVLYLHEHKQSLQNAKR